jgi:hypothetical protein
MKIKEIISDQASKLAGERSKKRSKQLAIQAKQENLKSKKIAADKAASDLQKARQPDSLT